jgi:hypothetical protein
MQEIKKELTVVIAGDITVDCNIAHDSRDFFSATEWTGKSNCSVNYQYGSVALIAGLIQKIGQRKEAEDGKKIGILSPKFIDQPIDLNNKSIDYSYAVWGRFYDDGDKKNKWRVKQFLGVDKGKQAKNNADIYFDYYDIKYYADIVVLDDSDLGFRHDSARWEKFFYENNNIKWVVVKMSPLVAKGELWEYLINKYKDRLIVVLNVDDLRQSQIRISARISWEKTAQELLWELANNPEVDGLINAAYSIISFGATGALMIANKNRDDVESILYFDKMFMEGEWTSGKGMMIGSTSTLVAGIVRQLLFNIQIPDIEKGIQSGVSAIRHLYTYGYHEGENPDLPQLCFPFDEVISAIEKGDERISITKAKINTERDNKNGYYWTILEESSRGQIIELCYEIVKKGVKLALNNVPVGKFGKLVTVDRREIESLRSISGLISEYCNRQEDRPLSIAVFGPPGSGKSFAVNQIAKVANPDKIADDSLTFNLSQFNKSDELIDAFHQIRDIGLSGKIPLVFWDEFDTEHERKKLGWLRFFLAPMQDGEFQDGQLTHPIGKAIFVFAGGTSCTYNEFIQKKEELSLAKGVDFLSRIKGYLNILGPNRQSSCNMDDDYFVVRRAILLRSMFERKTPQLINETGILNIDKGVLNAFLWIDYYRHGARSVESIILMSKLWGVNHFTRSCLPPDEQLDLHVDSKRFIMLVQQYELHGELLDQIVEAYQKIFFKGNDSTNSADGNNSKEISNRAKERIRVFVREIPNKLASYGYLIIRKRNHSSHFVFENKVLRCMAEEEFNRSLSNKSKTRDWKNLTRSERDEFYKIINAIPNALESLGFTLVKLL